MATIRLVGVGVEVGPVGVAEGAGLEAVGVFEGAGVCTNGVKGMVVIVGMIAVWDNKASAVVVASPLRKIWSTERVGVGFRLFNRFFPAGVPTRI